MRTIETKLFSFNELSEEAKEKAIENVRQSYYEYNDFAEWAVDDCALLEPKHEEVESIEGYSFPLLKNTRGKIYFDTGRSSFIDCEDAIEVTNNIVFYKWLQIPEEVYNGEDFNYEILTPKYRNSDTTIIFDGYLSEHGDVIDDAIDKFNDLMSDVLQRIENDIDFRFSDESIEDDIVSNEYEFEENGNRW